jgi:hypothetical protein
VGSHLTPYLIRMKNVFSYVWSLPLICMNISWFICEIFFILFNILLFYCFPFWMSIWVYSLLDAWTFISKQKRTFYKQDHSIWYMWRIFFYKYTFIIFIKNSQKWFKIHEINKIHVSSKLMKNSSHCSRKEPSSSLEDGWKSLGNSVAFNYT